MSVLAYPPTNDDEILRYCTKKCGYITSTEDQQFFALGCQFCPGKFLYFDAYIGHVQREHSILGRNGNEYNDANSSMYGNNQMCYGGVEGNENLTPNGFETNLNEHDDLGDTDAALLVPQMVIVKQEIPDEEAYSTNAGYPNSNAMGSNVCEQNNTFIKEEQEEKMTPMDAERPAPYGNETYGNNEDHSGDGYLDEDEDQMESDDFDDDNYDDLVEETLVNKSGVDLAQHIKDRRMISFLIDSYRRNPYLWDHLNPHFRDRKRRQQFLDWMLAEFKRRFNVLLARDAITRKWDNLRTVYKRECNRMSLECTNVSSLWYFKELDFLHRLYGGNKVIEPIVKTETIYRKRYSTLWNDFTTCRLLALVRSYPCFYDRNHVDYRSKEKRGEALQIIATELQKIIDVSTIQISKRISQLRFDYSKQKLERLQCELNNKVFVPNYSYYDQLVFMDDDVAPFKCEFCGLIMQTLREQETHIVVHQTSNLNGFICPQCDAVFPDIEQFQRHKQSQHPAPPLSPALPSLKDPKFFCDLCTARFREKANYDEHMRRHNDELLLPGLANVNFETTPELLNSSTPIVPPIIPTDHLQTQLQAISTSPNIITNPERPFICDICGKSFTSSAYLAAHAKTHSGTGVNGERTFRCDYANCGRSYTVRQSYLEHMRLHYTTEGATCDICGKTFKSSKNLQNHKQIHDAIKRYVCKICGSAFAQAAGLYLHKRRHTRNADGNVDRHRGRQTF